MPICAASCEEKSLDPNSQIGARRVSCRPGIATTAL